MQRVYGKMRLKAITGIVLTTLLVIILATTSAVVPVAAVYCHEHGNVNYPYSHFRSEYIEMGYGVDYVVDAIDVSLFAYADQTTNSSEWGVGPGLYNPDCDFDSDGYVGSQDFIVIAGGFGHECPPPVGGIWVPVDKFGLLAPYIGLASTILVATAATAIYVKRVKRRKKKQ